MKNWGLFLFVLTVFLITTLGNAFALDSPLRVGWVIGNTEAGSVSILHTRNGGLKWTEQLDRSEWPGYTGNDISAVDRLTAWAALGSGDGVILHTTNGGVTWTAQELPDGVDDIKNIKGLSRQEAWAVSLTGTILHTTDGGETWNDVKHPSVPITMVNRMDVIGCVDAHNAVKPGKNRLMRNANIWIVDEGGGDWGMIHSLYTLYNGQLWRQESVPHPPGNGMHMVSAYSPRVVWAATTLHGILYRTLDGGENWESVGEFAGRYDFDDMCAPSPDTVWAVLNLGGASGGTIYHVRVFEDGEPEVRTFRPAPGYSYEGLTCVDDQTALAVGLSGASTDPSLPGGVIVSTTDGGQSWVTHPLPVDDVGFWKVSFVGARR
jgi:photosystem II stability/assembly factor-like uncharacterized protein